MKYTRTTEINLKKSIFIIVTVLISAQTSANNDWRSTCKSLSGLAESIMSNRQDGISMVQMMETAKGPIKELSESLIIDAYESPRYNTESMKKKTIENFRDQYYLQCVKQYQKK